MTSMEKWWRDRSAQPTLLVSASAQERCTNIERKEIREGRRSRGCVRQIKMELKYNEDKVACQG